MARLNQTVSDTIATHDGVRPVEQGEGDSFVAAFARASDAVAVCAGAAARAAGADPVAHRGAYRRNPVARRRQLRRPDHQPHRAAARSGPRRPDPAVGRDRSAWCSTRSPTTRGCPIWAPTRCGISPAPSGWCSCAIRIWSTSSRRCGTSKAVVSQHLPMQLTSFVGRDAQLTQVRELLAQNRLVTLTGAGGVGKTRLAIQVAGQLCRRIRRRGVVCGSGADHRPRAGAGRRWRAHSGCPTSPAAPPWTPCCGLFATGRCWWCWTTASTCWMPAPSWSSPCWVRRRG